MERVYNQVIDRTLKVWRPRTPNDLTREDARQIAENCIGFFQLLLQWDTINPSSHLENADLAAGLPKVVSGSDRQ